jgi:hypothetical protein
MTDLDRAKKYIKDRIARLKLRGDTESVRELAEFENLKQFVWNDEGGKVERHSNAR